MELIYSSIKDIEGLYKALADESRMKILFMLVEMGDCCVRDIQQVLKVPQPTVSRHLGYLKKMGLVDNSRKGKWNYYSIARHQSEIVKQHINLLKSVQSYRRIFIDEMRPSLDKLPARPKARKG
jgi:ArsR family transcriptional regulator, arsenate/arsenite/antimonite-responsive transcriptional repressor